MHPLTPFSHAAVSAAQWTALLGTEPTGSIGACRQLAGRALAAELAYSHVRKNAGTQSLDVQQGLGVQRSLSGVTRMLATGAGPAVLPGLYGARQGALLAAAPNLKSPAAVKDAVLNVGVPDSWWLRALAASTWVRAATACSAPRDPTVTTLIDAANSSAAAETNATLGMCHTSHESPRARVLILSLPSLQPSADWLRQHHVTTACSQTA